MSLSSAVLFSRMLARSRLRQWQLLREIADLGSLQRAAEAVNLSQPAATHALADIEELLGVALFERHAKGTRLTAAGAAVLPRVRQALQALAECADVVSALHAGTSGVLRIGAVGAAISGLLSRVLPAYTERYPAVTLQVRQQPPELMVRGLLDETLDLVLCRKPQPLPTATEFHELAVDRYAVVCSPQHPYAGRTAPTLAELASQTWLVPPTSTLADRDFHRLWGEGQMPRDLCFVATQSPLLMWAMLEQRQALALMPYNTARQWLDAGVLAEVPGDWGPELASIGALVRSEALLSPGPLLDLLGELRRLAGPLPPSAAT